VRTLRVSSEFGQIVFALLLFVAITGFAAEPDHHALVRFWIDTVADQEFMDQNHLRFQLEGGRHGEYYDIIVRPDQLPEVQRQGSRVEILYENIEEFWASRLEGGRDWGVYHTYSQTLTWMDDLHTLYPDLISARWSIGQGHEGNDIWAFRVSDNPETDEADEPEVLFDGLHHANEIMGMESTMMLAEYLAEQYTAGDQEIVELLNEREIYMVPIVNPDGMLYNEQTYPNGGATWRKNRRNNGDGTYGVDLNRNYVYEWGCEWGSSGVTSDPTYRGPSAGSEPEIQAMMLFIDQHEFVTQQTFHSSGKQTLYPWSYTTDDSPDEDIFREMSAAMCMYNGYTPGQCGDILYDVCGGTNDWSYGEHTWRDRIFSFCNELGTSQWPPASQRQIIFDDNIWPAIYLIQMAGSLRGVSWTHTPLPFAAANGVAYSLVAEPVGYDNTPIDNGTVVAYYRANGGASTEIALTPTAQPGEFGTSLPAQMPDTVVEYYLSASDTEGRGGTSPRNAPSALHYFEVGTEFTHAMEADRGWTVGDNDDDASTGLWVRVDPVGTAAQPEDDHTTDGTDCWVTGQHVAGETIGYNDVDGGKTTLFSPVYDLTGATSVTFAYWRWYTNDGGSSPGEDWWDVSLSNDGGQTWAELEHTQASNNAWLSQSFDLADYFTDPAQVQLKFVAADLINGSIVEAGVDDFNIVGVFDVVGADRLPSTFKLSLGQNYPNPFNPTTTVRFQIPEAGPVQLGVYDTSGRMVRSLFAATVNPGDYAVTWNGQDTLGRPGASGVYFTRLQTASGELSRRMVLLK